MRELVEKFGAEYVKVATVNAFKRKWLKPLGKEGVMRLAEHIVDEDKAFLEQIVIRFRQDEWSKEEFKKEIDPKIKRKLFKYGTRKTYTVRKGPKFSAEGRK